MKFWEFDIFSMLDLKKIKDRLIYKKSELAIVKKFKDLPKIDSFPFQNFNNPYIHNVDPLL